MTEAEKTVELEKLKARMAEVEKMGVRIDPTAAPTTPNILPAPGAGGWVPPGWLPIVAAVISAVCAAIGGVLLSPVVTGASIAAAIFSGVGTGLAAFFGIKSAGPRS